MAKKGSKSGWFSLQQAASAFGISPQAFSKSVRPLLGPEDVKGAGRRGVMIRLRGAINAWTRKEVEKAKMAADPMLTGAGVSLGLERFRVARAAAAELELALARREVIRLAEVYPSFDFFADMIRTATIRLRQEFGERAAAVLEEALDRMERECEAAFGPSPPASPAPVPATQSEAPR